MKTTEGQRAANTKYYLSNKEKVAAMRAAYHQKNKDKRSAENAKWRAENKDKVSEYVAKTADRKAHKDAERYLRTKDVALKRNSAWYKNNRARAQARAMARRMLKSKARPVWADLKAIAAVYLEAARLEEMTGIKHHVDHIVPLKGKNVLLKFFAH